MKISSSIKEKIFIVLGAIALMAAAFWNGYPIVYSDTSTYLASGFELETPFDRPITYGLFILITSLKGLTLWTVIFTQSLMLSYVLFLTIKYFIPSLPSPARASFFLLLFVSLFTGVSWMSAQLLADIFTPITILCMALILFAKGMKRSTLTWLYIIFTFSNTTHISHISLHVALLIGVLILRFLFKRFRAVPLNRFSVLLLLLLTLAGIATMGAAISKSKHVFMMARLTEHGILQEFLNDRCATEQYSLCAYKDSLDIDATEFLWNDHGKSPMYKTLGWQGSKEEYNKIINETFTTPKYLWMNIKAGVKATGRQLITFSVADGNGPFLEHRELYQRVKKFVPSEIDNFSESKQSQNLTLEMPAYNTINHITIIISLIGVIAIYLFKKFRTRITALQHTLFAFLFLSLIANAALTGAVSTVSPRYGCKVMWLIPMILIMMIISIVQNKTYPRVNNR